MPLQLPDDRRHRVARRTGRRARGRSARSPSRAPRLATWTRSSSGLAAAPVAPREAACHRQEAATPAPPGRRGRRPARASRTRSRSPAQPGARDSRINIMRMPDSTTRPCLIHTFPDPTHGPGRARPWSPNDRPRRKTCAESVFRSTRIRATVLSAARGTEGEPAVRVGGETSVDQDRARSARRAAAPAAAPSRRRRWAHSRAANPSESVRLNTPNDPDFDRCEPDDEQGPTCTNTFGQQYERFGFAPNGSQATALYHNPTDPHVQRHSAQNTLAGRDPARPDPGRLGGPRLEVLDRRGERAGRDPRHRDPLEQRRPAQEGGPEPRRAAAAAGQLRPVRAVRLQLRRRLQRRRLRAATHACRPPPGTTTSPARTAFLDASDLIVAFSDSSDDDGNGYVDDIAGWDFFDDDNNSYDASSYSSANNHGTGPRRGGRRGGQRGQRRHRRLPDAARSCRCASGTRSWSTRTTSRRRRCTRPTTTSRWSRARSARCSTRASRGRRSSTHTARACSSRSSRPT